MSEIERKDEIPRRARVDLWTPAEKAIQDAVDVVESMAADARLTDAVNHLWEARQSVADYVDGVPRRVPALVQERDTLARRVTWQPIETALKDAMALLVFVPGHGVQMGTWLPISMEWCWSDSDDTQPTHWMPLPAPPVRD